MKLYYGTTHLECNRIRRRGIRPPARCGELWLSRSLPVAEARARQLCRYERGRPMVAVCEVDVTPSVRRAGGVRCRGPMVGVRHAVDPKQIRDVLPVEPRARSCKEPVLTSAEVFHYLDSPSPKVRMMGIMMLSSQETPEAFDWTCTRLEDPDPRVRVAVAMALRRHGREAADVLAAIEGDEGRLARTATCQGAAGAALPV